MFRFGSSVWLYGLLLVPGAFALLWLAARSRRRALSDFAESELVARLTQSVSERSRWVKSALILVGLGAMVIALARPQFGTRVETVRSQGRDIVVAMDLSASMLAEDVSPNRLERARLAVLQLIDRLDGDRIGLVAFAGDAYVQAPLTTDYGAARMFLSAMHPDAMSVQGTNLGAALRVSTEAVLEGGGESPTIVLITDAEDHEEEYGPVLAGMGENDIDLYVVAIGTSEGVPIPVFDDFGNQQGFLRDEEGTVVTTRVDEQTIQELVAGSRADVILAGADGRNLDELFERIAGGDGDVLEERQITRFEEQYQIFLGIALMMLFVEWMISDRRKAKTAWAGRFE